MFKTIKEKTTRDHSQAPPKTSDNIQDVWKFDEPQAGSEYAENVLSPSSNKQR